MDSSTVRWGEVLTLYSALDFVCGTLPCRAECVIPVITYPGLYIRSILLRAIRVGSDSNLCNHLLPVQI